MPQSRARDKPLQQQECSGSPCLDHKALEIQRKLQATHQKEYERLISWETEHKVAKAAQHIQRKRQAAISSERDMDLQFGVSEEADYPSVDMGVASQGKYGEFGYEPAATEELGDPIIVDLEPMEALNNVIDQSTETTDCEGDVGSDSETADMESDSDEEPTGQFYGQNEYFTNQCFFHPPDTAQIHIEEPDNEWFPFDSRVDVMLSFYCPL